jgi:hypothetical protein
MRTLQICDKDSSYRQHARHSSTCSGIAFIAANVWQCCTCCFNRCSQPRAFLLLRCAHALTAPHHLPACLPTCSYHYHSFTMQNSASSASCRPALQAYRAAPLALLLASLPDCLPACLPCIMTTCFCTMHTNGSSATCMVLPASLLACLPACYLLFNLFPTMQTSASSASCCAPPA